MIVCLTGMHRSGTSLMSSYLEYCGINMGEKLVGGMRGNERGHFEDKEFVDLHSEILRSNNCHMYAPEKHMEVPRVLKERARAMISSRQKIMGNFGWKDPRSSLFLDLWFDITPESKFVFLYRPPATVIDSLRRRGTDRRIKLMPWLPARAWITYNQAIIDFTKAHPESSFLACIDGFNKKHVESRQMLSEFLGYGLDLPYTDVFHSNEIASDPVRENNLYLRMLDKNYTKEMSTVFEQLENMADIRVNGD